MAFRRSDAEGVGGFDPKFRFYRIADIEFSFRLRDRGGLALAVAGLPIQRGEHRLWEAATPAERDRLSKRNTHRFPSKRGPPTHPPNTPHSTHLYPTPPP